MATAYKCDWCKKLMSDRYEGEIMPAKHYKCFYDLFALDICRECGKKFAKFVEEMTLDEINMEG